MNTGTVTTMSTTTPQKNAAGTIVQVIGAVVDVEFNQDSVPNIFDALKMAS